MIISPNCRGIRLTSPWVRFILLPLLFHSRSIATIVDLEAACPNPRFVRPTFSQWKFVVEVGRSSTIPYVIIRTTKVSNFSLRLYRKVNKCIPLMKRSRLFYENNRQIEDRGYTRFKRGSWRYLPTSLIVGAIERKGVWKKHGTVGSFCIEKVASNDGLRYRNLRASKYIHIRKTIFLPPLDKYGYHVLFSTFISILQNRIYYRQIPVSYLHPWSFLVQSICNILRSD